MPQGSSITPDGFVKVVNEVVEALDHVLAYFDDVIDFGPNPAAHVDSIHSFFECL